MLRKSVLAALLALAACKTSTPQAGAAVPDTCSQDSECADKFRCDHELRRCVCTGDDACPGKFCNAFTGQCVDSVPGCTSDTACGTGQYCNRALRTCQAITQFCGACHSDNECGAGSVCAAHPDYQSAGTFCVPGCTVPAGGGAPSCANGLTCKKSSAGANLCYPSSGPCGQSNACVPDSLKLCSTDGDCGDPAQNCDHSLGACVVRTRTCSAGFACDPQSKLCVAACTADDDCLQIEHDPGYQCRANACFRLALCSKDADCNTGQICQGNQDGSLSCHAGCVTANDCPLGQGCSTADPNHPRCAAGCTQNADCALNTICSSGACVSTTVSCQQTCQDTAACPIGSTCTNTCCVAANLAATCGESATCGSCSGSGCIQSCAKNCFPLSLGSCNVPADCSNKGFPADVVCNQGLHQCQVLGALQPCASDANCTLKGFRCTQLSNLACGGAGGVCFPFEQSAQVACAAGHP